MSIHHPTSASSSAGWPCWRSSPSPAGSAWKALRDAKPEDDRRRPRRPAAEHRGRRAREKKEVVETLSVTGTLARMRRAEVAAREAAAVDALMVDEGDLVESGRRADTLDARRLEAQFQEARGRLTASRAELAQREAENERAVRDEEMMSDLWDQQRRRRTRVPRQRPREKGRRGPGERRAGTIEACRKRLDLLEVRETDLEVTRTLRRPRGGAPHRTRRMARAGDPVVTLVSTGEVEAWLQLPERHAACCKPHLRCASNCDVPGSAEPIHADRVHR